MLKYISFLTLSLSLFCSCSTEKIPEGLYELEEYGLILISSDSLFVIDNTCSKCFISRIAEKTNKLPLQLSCFEAKPIISEFHYSKDSELDLIIIKPDRNGFSKRTIIASKLPNKFNKIFKSSDKLTLVIENDKGRYVNSKTVGDLLNIKNKRDVAKIEQQLYLLFYSNLDFYSHTISEGHAEKINVKIVRGEKIIEKHLRFKNVCHLKDLIEELYKPL